MTKPVHMLVKPTGYLLPNPMYRRLHVYSKSDYNVKGVASIEVQLEGRQGTKIALTAKELDDLIVVLRAIQEGLL